MNTLFSHFKLQPAAKVICMLLASNLLIFSHLYFLASQATRKHDHIKTYEVNIRASAEEAKPSSENPQKTNARHQKPAQIKLPIFMYHHIHKNPDPSRFSSNMFVEVDNFQKQLEYLKNNDYTTILVKDIISAFNGEFQLPAKPVVLTFDDGYIEHYRQAYNLMRKYNMKGTFYIPTYIFHKTGNYWLTEKMAKEMASTDMEIGGHTISHPYLPNSSSTQLIFEIYASKYELESITHQQVMTLSYPYCAYNDTVISITKRAGYTGAVTCSDNSLQKAEEKFFLKRRIAPNNLEKFKSILELEN